MSTYRTILAFDYGSKRIGIAVGQELTRTAQALVTLTNPQQRPDWQGIATLIKEWRPQLLVVGLPVNMDGSPQPATESARIFGEELKTRYNLPVEWIDERLSSVEAEMQIKETIPAKHRQRHKQDVDKLAAAIILQTWLNQHSDHDPR